MRLNSRMHIWYTKILRKVLLNSDAGEFHPQEYNIHLVVGREDPADACSSVVPPHCSEGSSEYCLCLVPTITRLTQIKRNGGAQCLKIFETGISDRFHPSPSFPSPFFLTLHILSSLSVSKPRIHLDSLILENKNKQKTIQTSRKEQFTCQVQILWQMQGTDQAVKSIKPVMSHIRVLLSPSLWVSTQYYFPLIASFFCEDWNSWEHNYPGLYNKYIIEMVWFMDFGSLFNNPAICQQGFMACIPWSYKTRHNEQKPKNL